MSERVGPGTCADGGKGHPVGSVKVTTRLGNHSAFNGYRFTPSDYSEVRCLDCHWRWRTKAAYVGKLPNAPADWYVQG